MHGARNELFPLNASTTTSADLAARTASSINEHGAAPVLATNIALGSWLRIASWDSTTSESPTTNTRGRATARRGAVWHAHDAAIANTTPSSTPVRTPSDLMATRSTSR